MNSNCPYCGKSLKTRGVGGVVVAKIDGYTATWYQCGQCSRRMPHLTKSKQIKLAVCAEKRVKRNPLKYSIAYTDDDTAFNFGRDLVGEMHRAGVKFQPPESSGNNSPITGQEQRK